MKKILCGLVVLLALTGCSTPKNEPSNEDKQQEKEITVFYGKIESSVGNEINVDIAKNPFVDEDTDSKGDGDSVSMEAATLTDAIPAGDNSSIAEEELANKLELEYTGEKKSLVLPAGVKIIDSKSGSEIPMSEITEGTVVSITYDKTSDSIIEIYILEK